MSNESAELKARIAGLSDEALLQMVNVDFNEYRQEALDYANAEVEKRGLASYVNKPTSGVLDVDEKYKSETLSETLEGTARKQKRWFGIYVLVFLIFWVYQIIGGPDLFVGISGLYLIAVLFSVSSAVTILIAYVVALVYAYRFRKQVRDAGLHEYHLWPIIVLGVLLNPFVLGWLVLLIFLPTLPDTKVKLNRP